MTLGAGITAAVVLILTVPAAHALTKDQLKCQTRIAKEGGKFLSSALRERTKCANKNLDTTGSCDFANRDAKLNKIESKLRSKLQKSCVDTFPSFDALHLALLGFPGTCADGDPLDGFTGEDLKDCIFETHSASTTAIFDLAYGSNGDDGVIDFETRGAANARALAQCQVAIGTNSRAFARKVQKELAKCRNGLLKGKLTGFLAKDCGDNAIYTKPKDKIERARSNARKAIITACPDPVLQSTAMDVCDIGIGPQTTPPTAADCILDAVREIIDALIEVEYASGDATCGDNIVNDPAVPEVLFSNVFVGGPPEECDGTDDSACPGACGAPTSAFPCLCTNVLRERIVEHDNADLDHGWTGSEHDATIAGGGYVVDLYDCDGPAGPDVLCTVGPSCALAPHEPCLTDAECIGGGNFCRKTAIATDPHCRADVQIPCSSNLDCNAGLGDFCRRTPHGVPVPLSSSGLAICVVNIFSEIVTGTTNVATGSSAVRIRQNATAHLGLGSLNQPCPSCGGFCSGASSGSGPGERTLCTTDSDCPASATCITDAICSYGPNQDQACRPVLPFGNTTPLFGTPSVDCPPSPALNVSGDGLDVLLNPSTTGTITTLPSVTCSAPGFNVNKCILGAEIGKVCAADSECPGGGAGSCVPQCFCPHESGAQQKPNDCLSACHGGINDYGPCATDSECPGGLCESASCRSASGVCTGGSLIGTACSADSDCVDGPCGDDDSSGEGFCPGGPIVGLCSTTTFQTCVDDAGCRPSGGCPLCEPDDSEVCAFKAQDCFPSVGYTRIGTAGVPDRVDVAHFCLPGSGSPALDAVQGLPGPGALEQPTTTILTLP